MTVRKVELARKHAEAFSQEAEDGQNDFAEESGPCWFVPNGNLQGTGLAYLEPDKLHPEVSRFLVLTDTRNRHEPTTTLCIMHATQTSTPPVLVFF